MGLHVGEVGARGEGGQERGVGGKGVEADPGIDRRPAPGRVDHTDGNMFAPVDLSGEEVGDGGEVFGGLGGAWLPYG
jgi:hypothetical protein